MTRAARVLLLRTPILGAVYAAAVLTGLVAARPEVVTLLAAWPIFAGVLAASARAKWIVAVAVVELMALVPLHGLVTFVRAWRLEGG